VNASDLVASGERSLRTLLESLDAAATPECAWRALDRRGGTLHDVDVLADLGAIGT
jgi:hypothetical protein